MNDLIVRMNPLSPDFGSEESGIRRVIEAYERYLPQFGIKLVGNKATSFDLRAAHAGSTGSDCDIAHLHGLYWGGDINGRQRKANASIVKAIRQARAITVPSQWVAETFRRDMKLSPHVIPHGIDSTLWQKRDTKGYVLWNKNRVGDVCSPESFMALSRHFPNIEFVSTLGDGLPAKDIPVKRLLGGFFDSARPTNKTMVGLRSHQEMKTLVEYAGVYLSTAKETFGIGVLEALAAGVPVLGWDQGGNRDLIQHGVNGYLAPFGDYEALSSGLEYCLEHRDTLSLNASYMIKQWTWENACLQLADIYRLIYRQITSPSRVAVVIPVYNKSLPDFSRALSSVLNQNRLPDEVIVVNDGSKKDYHYPAAIKAVTDKLGGAVIYIDQHNQGVAVARNNGILATDCDYICCLDADDWLDPQFLKVCVDSLDGDPSIGMAYTGLMTHLPDGKEALSQWPKGFDFDEQLRRKNQVPTCNVFRKALWERAGGFRSRYCPDGAGSEDAALWTAIGSLGYRGEQVTTAGLFHYTAFAGNVSGNRDYTERDWLAFYPWAKDNKHPFASVASPKQIAHDVPEYDEPMISIIIPVGAGHVPYLWDALDSIEAQTFREWEVIIADDRGDNSQSVELERIKKAFPHVRWFNSGGKGAGVARNLGVSKARAPFILYLDADDYFNPSRPDALDEMIRAWNDTGSAIYTDYIGRAFIDDVEHLSPQLQRNILHRDNKDNETFIRYFALDYDCQRAMNEPNGDDPSKYYIWNIVSTLIPKAWHDAIGGFDESMETWEDYEYWLRMAQAGYCFQRVSAPFFVYRFYSGTRRDEAHKLDGTRQKYIGVVNYIRSKQNKDVRQMGCNCKGKKIAPANSQPAVTISQVQSGEMSMTDSDYKLCTYAHPNRGRHVVWGSASVNNGRPINYGYHGGGSVERFLVHVEDIKGQPHLFVPVEESKPDPVPVEKPPQDTPAPSPIVLTEDQPDEVEAENPFDVDSLGITKRAKQSLVDQGLVTVEAINKAGMVGLVALPYISNATAKKILQALE